MNGMIGKWVLSLGLLICLAGTATAMTVIQQKGNRVQINTEGASPQVGEVYNVLDESGKRVGAVRISKVSGGRAVGQIKGQAQRGQRLVLRKKTPPPTDSAPQVTAASSKDGLGFLFGYEMSNWRVDSGVTTNLKGNNFSLTGIWDATLDFMSFINFRMSAGYFMLDLKESGTSCDQQTGPNVACRMKVSYLTAGLMARYIFVPGDFRPFVGLGTTLFIPTAQDIVQVFDSSDSTNKDYIKVPSVTFAPSVAVGFDLSINPQMYVPFVFEYSFFAKTDTVSPGLISARFGLGWTY